MSDITDLTDTLKKFRDDRDWSQFHNPKDLAIAISVEAGELLQEFLWKDADNADQAKVKNELADILAFCLLLADKYNLNVTDIVLQKIKANGEKYPVDKSKGSAKKYNEL